jgi:hypothetical protein
MYAWIRVASLADGVTRWDPVHGHIHVVPTDLRVGGAQCPLRHCPIRDVGGLLHGSIKILQGGGRAVPHGLGAPTALLATLEIQPRTQQEAERRCEAQQPWNAPERAGCAYGLLPSCWKKSS